ncbi:MAG: Methylated-DNA--protein-cysteine methyltransferase [Chlamydiia bacterium]|nr:Methylated-DNA--protein-cysteine methyltransferase [Chlamydiia bacterium]
MDRLTYSFQTFPFGKGLIITRGEEIYFIGFEGKLTSEALLQEAKTRFSQYELIEGAITPFLLEQIVQKSTQLSLRLVGTPFQQKVWGALLALESGKLYSYKEVAKLAGYPKAIRAVATAIGQNPISFVIPCHRVITSSGEIGGYHWGIEVKERILAYEGVLVSSEF